MLDSLHDWNQWWSTGKVDSNLLGKPREITGRLDFLLSFKEVKVLVGMRRSGKSTILYQFIDKLLKGNEPRRILYVNFEDPSLSGESLKEVWAAYLELNGHGGRPFLFLDEVHRCKDWTAFLRKLIDLRKVEQAFVTDSSSKYLAKEYATLLTGREVSVPVFPLSFKEILHWNGVTPEHGQIDMGRMNGHLRQYLQWGGLPEVVLKQSPIQKKTLLADYLSGIVHRDIVERYDANYSKLKTLADALAVNTGCLFSPRKYSRESGISLDTLNNYISFMEEVFFVKAVAKNDRSLRKRQINPKKVYLLDTGFHSLFRNGDSGRLCENAVLVELLRRSQSPFYWNNGGECDFTYDGHACQVTENSDDPREMRGLQSAMEAMNLTEGTIITWDEEGTADVEGRKITSVPLWKWLLESSAD